MQIVIGRFAFLTWHAIDRDYRAFPREESFLGWIQLELDAGLSADQRTQQFEDIDTW